MLKDKVLGAEIIWLYHNILVTRHGGKWKTTELVTRNYWWLEMTRDMEKYVDRYDMCQEIKNRAEVPAGKLKLSKIPKKLWTYLIVDFITKLLLVARKDTILVVCDRLSKIIHFVAITKETSVKKISAVV